MHTEFAGNGRPHGSAGSVAEPRAAVARAETTRAAAPACPDVPALAGDRGRAGR
ncbi:hypothetical protein QFZ52_002950 [Arthrobacter woluwensis]|uniref:hypothetical protein n=1 Tax=Arthrobacter woluwensis TaxID=156980 RepID=UPI0027861193|nr:hypothetical protein [Arthrobacter woluwensis]MDQ0710298.1 hypothetical protein [Arthrobacter woluwensis]